MAYSGKYRPRNIGKYAGNPDKVTYRSLWERKVFFFFWLDHNPDVIEWSSENVVIPYRCQTDNRIHRYFVDLYVEYKSGNKYLIEIKPNAQTRAPKKPKHHQGKRRYIQESLTYKKNKSKWLAAEQFCEMRGWKFNIWDEYTLQKIGIRT